MIDSAVAERVSAASRGRSDDALRLLSALSGVDAPSGDPSALGRTADLLEAWFSTQGVRPRRIRTALGTHLEARIGEGSGPPILVLGHYDTVWPLGTAASRPLRVAGGVAAGPGVFDMRGGIAASLTAIAVLRELGELSRPVSVLLTADEEIGSRTSEDEIVRLGRDASFVLIPEPPLAGGALKTRRKGVLTYSIAIRGRAAHAGLDPERGISAVSELASLVGELEGIASPAEGTTVNVGVVAGGSRSNVVAAEAAMEVDIRVSTMAEYDRVSQFLAELRSRRPGVALEVRRLHARPPMERTEAIATAAQRAAAIARLAGIDLGEGAAGGASDGNFLSPLGVSVLDGLGPDGGGAHALDEHVSVASLDDRVVLIALLLALL